MGRLTAKTQQVLHESTELQAAAVNIVVAGFLLPLQPSLPSWFNHIRLLEPIGYIPLAEAEANYWRQLDQKAETTRST